MRKLYDLILKRYDHIFNKYEGSLKQAQEKIQIRVLVSSESGLGFKTVIDPSWTVLPAYLINFHTESI